MDKETPLGRNPEHDSKGNRPPTSEQAKQVAVREAKSTLWRKPSGRFRLAGSPRVRTGYFPFGGNSSLYPTFSIASQEFFVNDGLTEPESSKAYPLIFASPAVQDALRGNRMNRSDSQWNCDSGRKRLKSVSQTKRQRRDAIPAQAIGLGFRSQ